MSVFERYGSFITRQLIGNFLNTSSAQERLKKANTDADEISRLFNDLHYDQTGVNELYNEVFIRDPAKRFEKIHAIVKETFQQILANQKAILEKLPLEHQDLLTNPTKKNLLIKALVTGCLLELNEGYNNLPPPQQEKMRVEFANFRSLAEYYVNEINVNNIFSEQPIGVSETARIENLSKLSTVWEMTNGDKINQLKNSVIITQEHLNNYLTRNHKKLNEDQITRLEVIIQELQSCRESLNFDLQPFAINFERILAVQNTLSAFKHELKDERQHNFMAQVSHQTAKLLSPQKTISGITASLGKALNESRPDFIPNPTQYHKEQLRKLSNASTTSIETLNESTHSTSLSMNKSSHE